jgi:hypothetical protein
MIYSAEDDHVIYKLTAAGDRRPCSGPDSAPLAKSACDTVHGSK